MNENDNESESGKQDRKILMDNVICKQMKALPAAKREQFLLSLEMVRMRLPPALRHEKLKSAGNGVIELKINGSPAYRCMYVVDKNGDVVVLHVTSKTARGQDRQLIKTTAQRFKRLLQDR